MNNEEPVTQRYQANARERYRTHSVNAAYSTLRRLIPTEPANRRLSKIETLRLATSYISHLDVVLFSGSTAQPCLQLQRRSLALYSETNNVDCWQAMKRSTRPQICTFCLATDKKCL